MIGEEIEAKKLTLVDLTNLLSDIICKRHETGKDYGVFLIPEGVIEFVPEVKVLISEINDLLGLKHFTVPEAKEHVLKNLTPEALATFNFIPEQVSQQLLLDRDPHGNV